MTPEGWSTSKIGEVVEMLYRYPTFYGLNRPLTGIPVVRGEHLINNGEISSDLSQYWFVSNEDSKRFPNTVLEEHDIVMAVRGTVGKFSRTRKDHCGFQISPNTIRISPDPVKIFPPYLFFALHSKEVSSFLLGSVATSAVPGIRAQDIKEAPLILPAINEQKAISYLLTSIYDKIELNRKTNEILEAMAKALFKSWFVDFDPVRAKVEGRPTGLPAEISDLFPDSFEDSELGEIPSGWEVKALDEIAHFLNGLALQKFPPEDGAATLPVIKIAQLKKGDSTGADRCSTAVPSDYVVRDGDMLFSWSGSLAVDIWCGGDGALNQHLFKVTLRPIPSGFSVYG